MLNIKASTQIIIVNFMTPGARVPVLGHGHIGHILKMHYSFENLLHYSWPPCRPPRPKIKLSIASASFVSLILTSG